MFNSKQVRILKINTKVIYILPIIIAALIIILGMIFGGMDAFNKTGIKYIENNYKQYYYHIYSVFGVRYQAVALLLWALIVIPCGLLVGVVVGIICNAYLLHIYYLASINKQLLNGISPKESTPKKKSVVAPVINAENKKVSAPVIEEIKEQVPDKIKYNPDNIKPINVNTIKSNEQNEKPILEEIVKNEAASYSESTFVVEETAKEKPVIEEVILEEPVKEESVVEEVIVEETAKEKSVNEEAILEDEAAEKPVVEEAILEDEVAEDVVIEEVIVEDEATEPQVSIIDEIFKQEEQINEDAVNDIDSIEDDFLAALENIPEANSYEAPNVHEDELQYEEIEEVQYVDEDGNPVDENGNPIGEAEEEIVYVDEDGNEIDPADLEVIEEEVIEEIIEQAPKPKRGRPRKKAE